MKHANVSKDFIFNPLLPSPLINFDGFVKRPESHHNFCKNVDSKGGSIRSPFSTSHVDVIGKKSDN